MERILTTTSPLPRSCSGETVPGIASRKGDIVDVARSTQAPVANGVIGDEDGEVEA